MNKRVVVIDDDPVTLKLLEKILTKMDLDVQTVMDGMKGWDLIHMNRPSLVISDMLIPKLHGLDLTKRIREDSFTKDITVILMSAIYKGPMFEKDIKNSGADFFITKPIDTPKLKELIGTIISSMEDAEE
jgi:CheY-like chemotaxis protein